VLHYCAGLYRELKKAIDCCSYKGIILVPRAALWIDDDTHLEPDLMYISDDLKRELKPGRRTRADIVVEILSSATALYDRTTKSDTYRAMGVKEMWLVDPDSKEIEVRSFVAEGTSASKTSDLLRSAVLGEIQISVGAVFT
jgi:Uma2 family endonuclease